MRALESATLGKNTESISKGEEKEKEKEEERENDRNVEGEQGEKKLKERAVAIDDRTEELSVESIKNRVRACSSGVTELDMEKVLAGKTSEEIKRIENESRQVAAGIVTESLGYLKEMLGNVPGSAKRVVEGIGSAAVHPVRTVHETFDLIFTVLAGKLERMFGYENLPEQQALEKMRLDFGKMHGSISAELETLKKDPVGEGLAIASIVTGGVGMAREAVGLAGKTGAVGRVAEIEQAGAIVRTGEGVIKAEQAVSRGVPVEETADTAFSVGKMIGEAGSEGEFPGAVSLETKVATLGVGGKGLNHTKEVEEVLPDAEFPVETTDVPARMNDMEDISHIGAIGKAGALDGAEGIEESQVEQEMLPIPDVPEKLPEVLESKRMIWQENLRKVVENVKSLPVSDAVKYHLLSGNILKVMERIKPGTEVTFARKISGWEYVKGIQKFEDVLPMNFRDLEELKKVLLSFGLEVGQDYYRHKGNNLVSIDVFRSEEVLRAMKESQLFTDEDLERSRRNVLDFPNEDPLMNETQNSFRHLGVYFGFPPADAKTVSDAWKANKKLERYGEGSLTEEEKRSIEVSRQRVSVDLMPESADAKEGRNDHMRWMTFPRWVGSSEFTQVRNRILELKVFEMTYDDVVKEYRKSLEGK